MRTNILAALTLTVALSLSTTGAFASGWGVQTTIAGYYVYDAGAAYIKVTNPQNSDGCANSTYLVIDTDAKNFHAIWAQVIAAQASGSTVSVRYNGCIGNYPKIDAVAIPNTW